jgi:tetratricopeptide (TPR) repeat protein
MERNSLAKHSWDTTFEEFEDAEVSIEVDVSRCHVQADDSRQNNSGISSAMLDDRRVRDVGLEASLLAEALAYADSDAERAEIFEAHGELLAIQLGEHRRSIAFFEEALRLNASSERALEGLEKAYIAMGEPFKLVEVLEWRYALGTVSSSETVLLLCRIANVMDSCLEDSEGAAHRLWRILSVQSRHLWAVQRLSELCGRMGKANSFVSHGELLVTGMDDPEDRSWTRRWISAALSDAGRYECALRFLERSLDDRECFQDTVEAIEERLLEWGGLHSLGGIRLDEQLAEDDYAETISFHMQRSRELELSGATATSIRLHLERVLCLDMENVLAWTALQRLAVGCGELRKAAYCLLERVQRVWEPSERSALFVELGEIWEGAEDGCEHASAAYRLAIECDPANAVARRALARLSVAYAWRPDPLEPFDACG